MAFWHAHRVDLPAWIATAIGKITAEWSDLEWKMEEVVRLLLGTDIERGRIAVNGMNMRNRVRVANNLVQSRNLNPMISKEATNIGTEITERVEGERNMVVHAIWARVEGEWYILRTSGVRKDAAGQKLARAVLPQREHITPARLLKIRTAINSLRARVDAFHLTLEGALPSSPHISPRQHRQPYPSRARRKKALSHQPQSSRG